MAAGAIGLATTMALNWGGMSAQLANTLALITGVVGGFMLALGAIMAFSGANVPLGVALMAAGAVSLATGVAVNWHSSDSHVKDALTTITGILAGASLAVGAMLALTGVNMPLGIALIAIGAVSLASALALNWNSIDNPISEAVGRITLIVGTALLALGAILAFSGGSLPLGIAFMVLGAASIGTALVLNWNGLSDNVRNTISIITAAVSVAFLALGAVLAFSGANIPLGIALMVTGAATLASSLALNWNTVLNKVKETLKNIGIAAGAALLALGLILIVTGVGIPLGIGLLVAGAASLASGVALNWNFITEKVSNMLSSVVTSFKNAWSSIKNVWSTVKTWFSTNVINPIKTMFSNINLKFKLPHFSWSSQPATGWISKVLSAIGLPTSLPKLSVSWYENGGFPEQGQLFVAREAGAEMVGSIGNKAAVVNNDQIIEGVSQGVYEAVVAALSASGVNEKQSSVVKVYLDGKEITSSVEKRQRDRGATILGGVVYA
jgi:2-keto-3-deoxy-L-rhamnonate aldolase RhmA